MQAALASYLASVFAGPVEVLGLRPLGGPDASGKDPKGFGYGVPFEVECVVDGFDLCARGSGSSRRAAEQQAAEALLGQLGA